MPRTTRRIVLARPIRGLPAPEDFRLEEVALAPLDEGQALIRVIYASVDPGSRSRLSGEASYAPPLKPGDVIDSFCVGEVIESRSPRAPLGALVAVGAGWAEHAVFPGRGYLQVIPHRRLPLAAWIGALGVPGMTAWFGLSRVAALQPGERVLVTSAAGPVGALAGQIAKAWGASLVVGVAGGAEKRRWLREIGFDVALDRRDPGLADALAAAAPEGFDVMFDNVGAEAISRALPLMRPFGRIVASGQVAEYNDPAAAPGLTGLARFISHRLRLEGLVVFDDLKAFPDAQAKLGALLEAGAVQAREVRYAGLEAAPRAFVELFSDPAAFGRRIVEVGAEPAT